MNMKKVLYIYFAFMFIIKAQAQQDPMYSQYWINAAILNPAQIAADGNTTLNLTGRYQWVNLEGAPKTTSVAFGGMPVNKLGVGLSYVYDEIGPVKSSTLNADVAYHLKASKNWTVTIGTRLSAMNSLLNLTSLYTNQQSDPAFSQNLNTGIMPNIGFGVLIHNDKFYFGFSQPRSIEYDLSTSSYMNTKIISNRFAYAGYNLTINDDIELRPSILFKDVNYSPFQLDFNLVAEFNNTMSIGASYRTGDGIGVMLGLTTFKNLKIFYCYDYPLSVISLVSKQTHQLSIVYSFQRKGKRINSPRYFE